MADRSDNRSRVDLEMFSDFELWQYLKKRLEPQHNWEPYLVGEAAIRIARILTTEQKDIELNLSAKAEELAAFEQQCRRLQSKGKAEYFRAAGEHANWRARVLQFKRLVDRRTAEARGAADRAKREIAAFQEERRAQGGRESLRALAVAVDAHRRTMMSSGTPASSADQELWKKLAELTVDYSSQPDGVTLQWMIDHRHWS